MPATGVPFVSSNRRATNWQQLTAKSNMLKVTCCPGVNAAWKEFNYGTAPIFQDGRDISQAKKGRIYFWGLVCGKWYRPSLVLFGVKSYSVNEKRKSCILLLLSLSSVHSLHPAYLTTYLHLQRTNLTLHYTLNATIDDRNDEILMAQRLGFEPAIVGLQPTSTH